ncbi:flagella basal body P-ring formation protein FlgA [Bryocella elongata]|nr:flagella basal body P-ring formation protein FlgA [Bryocella elongata]
MKTTMLAMLGGLTVSASAGAQMHRTHVFNLSAGQVTHVIEVRLAEQGVAINGARIEMLSRVVSSSEQPALHVTSILSLDHTRPSRKDLAAGMVPRFAVRVACDSSRDCLPFYAVVSMPAGLKVTATPVPKPQVIAKTQHVEAALPVVKAGSNATMIMNSGDAHIQMTVKCLEDGVEGQTIRVSNPLNHNTLEAQVVRSGLVKGSF